MIFKKNFTAAAEPATPTAEPSGRRLLATAADELALLLPALQPSLTAHVPLRGSHSRTLLQTAAEPVPAPSGAEPEPAESAGEPEPTPSGDGAAKVTTFGSGACQKVLNDAKPQSHPMDNQDIVMATARAVGGKNYIRVQVRASFLLTVLPRSYILFVCIIVPVYLIFLTTS